MLSISLFKRVQLDTCWAHQVKAPTHTHTKSLKKKGVFYRSTWVTSLSGCCWTLCAVFPPPFFFFRLFEPLGRTVQSSARQKDDGQDPLELPIHHDPSIRPSVRPSTARLIKAHNFFFPSTQMSSNPFFIFLSFSSRVETRWKAPPSKNQSKQQQQQHKHVCDFHFWF